MRCQQQAETIADVGLRIAELKADCNPPSESDLDIHTSEAGYIGDAIDVAQLADSFS